MGVASAGAQDRDLKLISAGPPVYPAYCFEKGFQGYVDLQFVVDTRGMVKDPAVVNVVVYRRNPGKPIEDEKAANAFIWAAKKAMENFRYEPPTVNGGLVEKEGVSTRITFALE